MTILIILLALACHALNFFDCDCSFLHKVRENFNLIRWSELIFIIIKRGALLLLNKSVHQIILFTLIFLFTIVLRKIWWFNIVEKMTFELALIFLLGIHIKKIFKLIEISRYRVWQIKFNNQFISFPYCLYFSFQVFLVSIPYFLALVSSRHSFARFESH